jgi:hypothetical protein
MKEQSISLFLNTSYTYTTKQSRYWLSTGAKPNKA